MKTELNRKNKAIFFAQYWVQKCLYHKNSRPLFVSLESIINTEETIDAYCAYLKPISSITEDDAKEVDLLLNNQTGDLFSECC